MKYNKTITLKNGMECCLRNGTEKDGQAVFENFNLTHGQTDFLLSYPDENSFDAAQEGRFLEEKSASKNEAEILALVDGRVVGTAGIEAVGKNTRYATVPNLASASPENSGVWESARRYWLHV